jgi:hypothetical protein
MGARFQAEVLLRLARQAASADPARGTAAHRPRRTGTSPCSVERVCLRKKRRRFVRLGYEYGQDLVVGYGNDRVVRPRSGGRRAGSRVNVGSDGPAGPGRAARIPTRTCCRTPLKVTNKRLITYRAQSRMAISADGLQVSRARAEKGFMKVVTTVTVHPDGVRRRKSPPAGPTCRRWTPGCVSPQDRVLPMPDPAFDSGKAAVVRLAGATGPDAPHRALGTVRGAERAGGAGLAGRLRRARAAILSSAASSCSASGPTASSHPWGSRPRSSPRSGRALFFWVEPFPERPQVGCGPLRGSSAAR